MTTLAQRWRRDPGVYVLVDEEPTKRAFSPTEARVPKGQPTGGQWTMGTGQGSMNSNAEGYLAAGGRLAMVTPANLEKVKELYAQTEKQLEAKKLFQDTGDVYTGMAIDLASRPDTVVRLAQTKTGHVAGAIAWAVRPADLYCHFLGSTGIAPGTGSVLTRLMFKDAAKRGVGISLSADLNAIPFWQKMGFARDSTSPAGGVGHMEISAEAVVRALPK